MSTEISSKERDHAEEEGWELMYKLMEVDLEDPDAVRKAGTDLLYLPAEKIRDYELRDLLEYWLIEFQSSAEGHRLWDIMAKVILLGVRLKSKEFIDDAEMLGFEDPLKVPLDEIAQALKKDKEEADKYLPRLYDTYKRFSSAE